MIPRNTISIFCIAKANWPITNSSRRRTACKNQRLNHLIDATGQVKSLSEQYAQVQHDLAMARIETKLLAGNRAR